jgi:hypothetical protein
MPYSHPFYNTDRITASKDNALVELTNQSLELGPVMCNTAVQTKPWGGELQLPGQLQREEHKGLRGHYDDS